jgi:deazaflavin-dependent oxidoreductase (nitroreductase family)
MSSSVRKKPQGLLRLAFRLPIWLYRFRLGWLLDSRFLLLTHTGRKSGQQYQTVVEVIRHDKAADTYYVVSGFGRNADWYRNVKHNPNVVVTVGARTTPARAEFLSPAESAQEVRSYAERHPIAFTTLTRFLLGYTPDLASDNVEQLAEAMPVVAFRRA